MSSPTPAKSDYERFLQEILLSLSQKNAAVDDSDNTIWMPIDQLPASNEDVQPSRQLEITRLEAEHLAYRLSKGISGEIEQHEHERLAPQWKPPKDWHALVNELSELKNRIEHSPNFDIIRTIIPVPIGYADEVFNDSLTIGWPKTLFDFIEKKTIVDLGDASPIGTYICFVDNRLSEIVRIIDPWMDKIVEWTVSEWWIEPVVEETSQTAVGIKLNLLGDYRKKTKSGLCGCIDSLIRWLPSQPCPNRLANPITADNRSVVTPNRSKQLDTLFIAALKEWHCFDSVSVTCSEAKPIPHKMLAAKMGVGKGGATKKRIVKFFVSQGEYEALCKDLQALAATLFTIDDNRGINKRLADSVVDLSARLRRAESEGFVDTPERGKSEGFADESDE